MHALGDGFRDPKRAITPALGASPLNHKDARFAFEQSSDTVRAQSPQLSQFFRCKMRFGDVIDRDVTRLHMYSSLPGCARVLGGWPARLGDYLPPFEIQPQTVSYRSLVTSLLCAKLCSRKR